MIFLLFPITALEADYSWAAFSRTLDSLALHGVSRLFMISRGIDGRQFVIWGLILLENVYLASEWGWFRIYPPSRFNLAWILLRVWRSERLQLLKAIHVLICNSHFPFILRLLKFRLRRLAIADLNLIPFNHLSLVPYWRESLSCPALIIYGRHSLLPLHLGLYELLFSIVTWYLSGQLVNKVVLGLNLLSECFPLIFQLPSMHG